MLTGFDDMFLYDGESLNPLGHQEQWFERSIRVFDGDVCPRGILTMVLTLLPLSACTASLPSP